MFKRISFLLVPVLSVFLSFTSVSAQTTKPLSGMCIVLVHGILGFDDTQGLLNGLVKYWGGLDNYLRDQGAKVATPGSSAMNDLPTRASQVKQYLNEWMPANGCAKVHLMGHSQGGLVSRYLVTNLGYSSKVATLTTINSVHRGSPVADVVLGLIPEWLKPFANVVVSSFAKLIYRDNLSQDAMAMGKSLTVAYLKTFNTTTTNVSTVKYYSYGSAMAFADLIQHPLMGITYPATWAGGLYYSLGSANDGIVPLESQKWGNWKGEPSTRWYATGLDHLQATNFEWSGQFYYDVQGHYMKMALNAKAGL